MSDFELGDREEYLLSSPMQKVRSSAKLIVGGVVIACFIVLISLVSYDIYLSKHLISQMQTGNNNNNNNNANSPDGSQYSADVTSWMDFTANPCNDFYQYSCGGFMDSYVLPSGVNMYIPIFTEVAIDNYKVLKEIVNDQWPLVNDMYLSCMAPSRSLTSSSTSSILSILSVVQQLNNTKEAALFPLLASLHRMGVLAFFVPTQQENIFQPGSLIYPLVYGSTLPLDFTKTSIQKAITSEIFNALDNYVDITVARAQEVMKLEAKMTAIDIEGDSYFDTYVNMSFDHFLSITNLDYSIYTTALGLNMTNESIIIAATPSFFSSLSSIFNSSSLQSVTDYLMWRVVYSFQYQYPIIPESKIVEEEKNTEIQKELKNSMKKEFRSFVDAEFLRPHLTVPFTTQELDCIDAVDSLLGDFVGLLFTLKVLDDDVINDIRTVTGGIQNSFRNNLASLDWIDAPSKANATYKLNNILQIIGHPNKLDRYRGLSLDPTRFLDNIILVKQRVFDDNMQLIGTVYDRSQNEFPATIVNAFYNPEANTINFPAGILESPMFSSSFPKLMQYARMGYVIGHETTHGFDNQGRMWDAKGVYQPIMDEISDAQFTQRAQCIVSQYNNYEPVPGYYVNGRQTLGENIADLGGVKNAFLAYKAWVQANGTAGFALNAKSPIVPQLTNEQAFFVVLAQTWCTKANDAGLVKQLQTDVHSPSMYRVNGPLSNLDYFSNAFNCPSNSPMNKPDKCALW